MKKSTIILLGSFSLLLIVSVAVFWPRESSTSIKLAGTAGTTFTGYYVQHGQRVAVAASLPWAYHGAGISQFEFQKTRPADTFTYEIKRDGLVGRFFFAGAVSPVVQRFHGQLGYWDAAFQFFS